MKSKEEGIKMMVLALCTADFRMDGRSYFQDVVNMPSKRDDIEIRRTWVVKWWNRFSGSSTGLTQSKWTKLYNDVMRMRNLVEE